MKRNFWVLVLLMAALGLAPPAWADDSFYVIAGGGVGTPITSAPYNITQPGFYYLKGNLNYSGSNYAIQVNTGDVTLDLMGFSLTGPSAASGVGIFINYCQNVEVRNGHVKQFNKGLSDAIPDQFHTAGLNHRIANLKVSGCGTGISCCAFGTVITNCQAAFNSTGIRCDISAFIIDKNTAFQNTTSGFDIGGTGGVVTNNAAYLNGTGFKFAASTGLLVDRNASFGNNTANWSGLDGCTKGLNTP